MLWSGPVSRVGASYGVNLIVPFPLGWTCSRKLDYDYDYFFRDVEILIAH